VIVAPSPEGFSTAQPIEIGDLDSVRLSVDGGDGRYILLGDPDGDIRLFFAGDGSKQARVFLIPHDDHFGARVHSVNRFRRHLAGQRAGPPLPSAQLSNAQRARLALQVRALDGVSAKTSRREIAAILLDPEARNIPAIEWKNSALRKKINRLIASAVALRNGRYLDLLHGDSARGKRFRGNDG
jgi:hypothetical protein